MRPEIKLWASLFSKEMHNCGQGITVMVALVFAKLSQSGYHEQSAITKNQAWHEYTGIGYDQAKPDYNMAPLPVDATILGWVASHSESAVESKWKSPFKKQSTIWKQASQNSADHGWAHSCNYTPLIIHAPL